MPGKTETENPFPSFSQWYQRYAAYTFKSIIIPLDNAFVNYLKADGIQLPNNQPTSGEYDVLSDSDSESVTSQSDIVSLNEAIDVEVEFRPLCQSVKAAITSLGDKILPKLNWSSPKDATWISYTRSMECTSFDDILMLLKSSDFIAFDVQNGASELVLRKWHTIDHSMEFRVFVRDGRLVGMCQRDVYNYYPFLSESGSFLDMITAFHSQMPTFLERSHVMDVYISNSRVYIVDFNPWSQVTDSLLYSWEELVSVTVVELRVIKSRDDPKIIRDVAFSSNRLPLDMFALGDGLTHDELVDKFRDVLAQSSRDNQ
jgi:D123